MGNNQDRMLGEKQRDGNQSRRDGDNACQEDMERDGKHQAKEDDEPPEGEATAAQADSYCHSWGSEGAAAMVDMAPELG